VYDVLHVPLAVHVFVEGVDCAEVAVKGTAPAGGDGRKTVDRLEQVMAGELHACQWPCLGFVFFLQPAMLEIVEHLRDHVFAVADAYGIAVVQGLVGVHGCMNAAHDDLFPPGPERGGDPVGLVHIEGDGRYADDVGIGVIGDLLQFFVDKLGLPVVGEVGREIGESEVVHRVPHLVHFIDAEFRLDE